MAKRERPPRHHLKYRAVFAAFQDDDPALHPNLWPRPRDGYLTRDIEIGERSTAGEG
ncbi:hypothetical protein [Sinorhizobium meliloti]|uniref:hypothetical protein n=1 Tax=Rhizobium meliloti TaxID=382 RepID=UPI0013E3A769|nr:hypothetical protein [Sinorhizobium meliloti]